MEPLRPGPPRRRRTVHHGRTTEKGSGANGRPGRGRPASASIEACPSACRRGKGRLRRLSLWPSGRVRQGAGGGDARSAPRRARHAPPRVRRVPDRGILKKNAPRNRSDRSSLDAKRHTPAHAGHDAPGRVCKRGAWARRSGVPRRMLRGAATACAGDSGATDGDARSRRFARSPARRPAPRRLGGSPEFGLAAPPRRRTHRARSPGRRSHRACSPARRRRRIAWFALNIKNSRVGDPSPGRSYARWVGPLRRGAAGRGPLVRCVRPPVFSRAHGRRSARSAGCRAAMTILGAWCHCILPPGTQDRTRRAWQDWPVVAPHRRKEPSHVA